MRATSGGLEFDTAEEAEYPWRMCLAYAEAIVADLKDLMIPPGDGQVGHQPYPLQPDPWLNQRIAE